MTFPSLARLLPLAAFLALLGGCPSPTRHAILDVSESGVFTLDDKPVAEDALPAVLEARHAQSPALLLEIHASPQVGMQHIQRAIAAARLAHIRVAFGKEPDPA